METVHVSFFAILPTITFCYQTTFADHLCKNVKILLYACNTKKTRLALCSTGWKQLALHNIKNSAYFCKLATKRLLFHTKLEYSPRAAIIAEPTIPPPDTTMSTSLTPFLVLKCWQYGLMHLRLGAKIDLNNPFR